MEAEKPCGPGWTPREVWFHLLGGRAWNICVFPTLCLILYIHSAENLCVLAPSSTAVLTFFESLFYIPILLTMK